MEHKHPTPARSNAAFDPSVAPVGPLIPGDSADAEPDENAITLPESETYDPAEYRWVPVRRRPRYDGWTEEKQRRFIEEIAAQEARGKVAWQKSERKEGELSGDEFRDMCHYLDPTYRHDKGRKRYR